MRFLLSGLLVLLLAVNMTSASLGADSAAQQQPTAMMGPGVQQTAHDCCTEPLKLRHGVCAICAAVHQAEVMPLESRLPRKMQHFISVRPEKTMALRPPQRAAA
ncbi:hypothetical protein [uncultured Paracoccus sp.]|uniref:hypothetical protein n=1 Tax=uncultured Paracoccus sp. TaxID=189685 RepID=UPI0026385F10|nr:hypothetical protein [uncultured Paracoccus sp.]